MAHPPEHAHNGSGHEKKEVSIKIIVETISPWKRSAIVSTAPMGPARTVLGSGRGREDTRRTPASA